MERVTGPEQSKRLAGRFPRTMVAKNGREVRTSLDAIALPAKPEDPRDD